MGEILTLDQIAANNCGVEIQAVLKKHKCVLIPRFTVIGSNPLTMGFDWRIERVVEAPASPKSN